MANRIEIGESVENALGLNITGAQVTVRFHGGAQAPVYDAQNGGTLLPQPLATVNGKIGADSPSGAWVASGDYDLDVAFGSDTLTFYWPASHDPQFVSVLPMGAGTSAPEDGELAIELYDSANGGAWLRRYRAALTAWDMVGGPPPSGNVLPGAPRVRQEFYLTGGSPTIQHLRYNGASWDYVGTPPMAPVSGSPLTILDTGQAGQIRAGRQLALTDFSTLLAAPTTPVGLFNLGSTANLGSGGVLTNKGAVPLTATGIEGVSNAAAQFTGATSQALYIADTGSTDPFRIKTGTWGCWFKTAKRGAAQALVTKWSLTAGQAVFLLRIESGNYVTAFISADGTAALGGVPGPTDVCDDRWHFAAASFDGSMLRVYVDGLLESTLGIQALMFSGPGPFNIGAFAADGATVASSPHFGRIDEAFVTADVLSADQLRLLYAAKIVHGYQQLPRLAAVGIRRRNRGAVLVAGAPDFPSQPLRLHNYIGGLLTDLGANNVSMVTNVGTGVQVAAAGPDGAQANSYAMSGAHTGLSATDAGLPSGTSTRSYGVWMRTSSQQTAGIMAWGTITTGDTRIVMQTNGGVAGALTATNATDNISTTLPLWDGSWHFVVVVEDNTAADGIKRKLYMDGRLVGGSTGIVSVTLAGANKYRVGANSDGTFPFTGGIGPSFVHNIALTAEQIAVLYQKSSTELAQSLIEPGRFLEGMDATNLYVSFDTLPSNYRADVAVAA